MCELNLWGIETWLFSSLSSLLSLCELNLWGIETKISYPNYRNNTRVWIEPVRDWNWPFLRFQLPYTICVNWTCEGLKREKLNATDCKVFGVNWTCEGLKLWLTVVLISGLLGVNWTCEGLKRVFAEKLGSFVPCVNWTCEGLKLYYGRYFRRVNNKCELNLWGIETQTTYKPPANCLRVNWTCEGLKLAIVLNLPPRCN